MNNTAIDAATLHSLGITLDPEKEAALIATLQKTLEERVGVAIIELLSDEKAAELESLTEQGSQEQISEWIAANVPDYEEIVKDEYSMLLGEVVQNADKL